MRKRVRRKSYRRKVRKTQVQRKKNLKSKRSKRSKRSKKYTKKKQRGGDYGKALIAGLISFMLLGLGLGFGRNGGFGSGATKETETAGLVQVNALGRAEADPNAAKGVDPQPGAIETIRYGLRLDT